MYCSTSGSPADSNAQLALWQGQDAELQRMQIDLEQQLEEVKRLRAKLANNIAREANFEYLENSNQPAVDHMQRVIWQNYEALATQKLGISMRGVAVPLNSMPKIPD